MAVSAYDQITWQDNAKLGQQGVFNTHLSAFVKMSYLLFSSEFTNKLALLGGPKAVAKDSPDAFRRPVITEEVAENADQLLKKN